MITPPIDSTRLKWPYNGMINDLRVVIEGRANFLAALGLLVYTETVGRWILQAGGRRNPTNEDAFYCFYERYMAKRGARRRKIYEFFRHGLAHGYTFNAADLSKIRMQADPDGLPQSSRKGVVNFQRRRIKSFLVNAYFRDFQRGLVKWATERPDLVLN